MRVQGGESALPPAEYDLALSEVGDTITLHHAFCPQVRALAMLGYPVATMFGCKEIPGEFAWHECLHQGLQDQGDQSRPEATK